jgi:hypothetical protein
MTVHHSLMSRLLSANASGGTQPHPQVSWRLLNSTRIEPWTGVAHYTTEDDIFEDYYIPKGQPTCIDVHLFSANVTGCRITRQIQYVARSGSTISLIPLSNVHLGRYLAHVKIQNHSSPRDIYFQTEMYPRSLALAVVFCMGTSALEDGA